MIGGINLETDWTQIFIVRWNIMNTWWMALVITRVGDWKTETQQIHPATVCTTCTFLGPSGWKLRNSFWEHIDNIREHMLVRYMHPYMKGIDWNMDRFTRDCTRYIQNREQRLIQRRSRSPQVSSRPEIWVCCRGLKGTSPPKWIITFGWVDLLNSLCSSPAREIMARRRQPRGVGVVWRT
jgi:hypothetical protein